MRYFNTETKEDVRFTWTDLDVISEALFHEVEREDSRVKEKAQELFDRVQAEMNPVEFRV